MKRKLFKKRFRLFVRKFAFSNRVFDKWNYRKCVYSLPGLGLPGYQNHELKHVFVALEPEFA